MKARLSVYLEPEIMAQLAAYAARRRTSLSLVSEAAIASFLSPDGPDRLEAAVLAPARPHVAPDRAR